MKTEVKALFKKFNANDKKDVIESEFKGGQVFVHISSSQMDMDDLDEESHEGLQYSVNGDGTVIVPANQMTIDELPKEGQEKGPSETLAAETEAGGANEVDPSVTGDEKVDQGEVVEKGASDSEGQSTSPENVTDITQERKRRGRPEGGKTCE